MTIFDPFGTETVYTNAALYGGGCEGFPPPGWPPEIPWPGTSSTDL